jgi:hypothetical protein
VVFAILISRDFGRVNGHDATGTQILIELEIDLRNDVVRIELLRQRKTGSGPFQFAGALQLDAPEIKVARVKVPGYDGVWIGLALNVQADQQALS